MRFKQHKSYNNISSSFADLTMAVKKNIVDYVDYERTPEIDEIINLMVLLRENPNSIPTGLQLLEICKSIVKKLGKFYYTHRIFSKF
jgi:hypothetical protein